MIVNEFWSRKKRPNPPPCVLHPWAALDFSISGTKPVVNTASKSSERHLNPLNVPHWRQNGHTLVDYRRPDCRLDNRQDHGWRSRLYRRRSARRCRRPDRRLDHAPVGRLGSRRDALYHHSGHRWSGPADLDLPIGDTRKDERDGRRRHPQSSLELPNPSRHSKALWPEQGQRAKGARWHRRVREQGPRPILFSLLTRSDCASLSPL